ncbi:MAG TPA: peptidylprolyl isomerase [Vicinamibacterales bacterium]|jgi:cyclophilin family peptidyl-prolyl cis-trans isomerase
MNGLLSGVLMMAMAAGTGGQTAAGNPVVVIETTMGDITVELDKAKAPVSVENFLSYVKDGYYPGTTFHRVIKGFMIQGGGLTADMQRKPGTKAPIQNEANNGLKNTRGTLAMARTGEVRSATSQFFINTADNAALDHKGMSPPEYGYAVFGKVIAGMDVVDKIEGVATASKGGHQNVPVDVVTIKNVRVKTS